MAKPTLTNPNGGDIYLVTVDTDDARTTSRWISDYADGVRRAVREHNEKHGTQFDFEFQRTYEQANDGVFAFKAYVYYSGDLDDETIQSWLTAGLDCVRRAKLKSVSTLADDKRSGTVEYNNELEYTPEFGNIDGVVVEHDRATRTVTVSAPNSTFGNVTKAHLKAVTAALQTVVA